jgi:hypothetical protein
MFSYCKMNRFYNTGFINSKDTEHRLKQGFLTHDVINVCAPFGTTCNQKSLYPVQQVQMELPVNIPNECDCYFYMTHH